jgi:xylulokinase
VLHPKEKPYVFAHIAKGMFTSAFSIFSGGSSLRWVRENLCRDIPKEGAYDRLGEIAAGIPIGSGGIIFNPSLAGGTSQDKSPHIRGAFLNLSLGSTREEIVRATMEGIALNLKMSLDGLKQHAALSDEILFCGGGSKSPFWMQMFADIFDMTILKTNVDQDAASLGAAAIAFVAMGLWENYEKIPRLHEIENRFTPVPENVEKYRVIFPRFVHANAMMSDLGEYIHSQNNQTGRREV